MLKQDIHSVELVHTEHPCGQVIHDVELAVVATGQTA